MIVFLTDFGSTMAFRKLILLSSALMLTVSAASFAADTKYVTDSFEITMRTGMGTSHKIIKSLRSGTKLDVIEVNASEGYSKVRLSDGTEGWVITRYLKDVPAAKDRLIAAEAKVEKANETIKQLRSELSNAKKQVSTLSEENEKLNKANSKIGSDLERIQNISAQEIALHAENEKLKTQVLQQQRNVQTLEQDNMSLKDNAARDWFVVGAGVIIVGIVLGLILPNLRLRRKNTWGSL